MKKSTGEIIQELREKNNMTPEYLASLIGKTRTTVYRYESGEIKKIPFDIIRKLSFIFRVPIFELNPILDKTDYEKMGEFDSGPSNYLLKEESVSYNSTKTFKLPYYLNLSAGCFDEIIEEPNNFVDVPNEFLRKRKNLIAFKINGDSMNKVIPNNSIIVIEKKEEFKSGDIVVASYHGECTIKRYQLKEDNLILIPESKNPEFYPMAFTKDDFVKILGKVVWYYPPYDVFE